MTIRTLPAAAIAALVVVFPAAAGTTPVPKTCPSKLLVASKLKQTVTKVTAKTTKSKTGTNSLCTYTTSTSSSTTITFGSPVTAAAFAASRRPPRARRS